MSYPQWTLLCYLSESNLGKDIPDRAELTVLKRFTTVEIVRIYKMKVKRGVGWRTILAAAGG
jgi:hypothetical protein